MCCQNGQSSRLRASATASATQAEAVAYLAAGDELAYTVDGNPFDAGRFAAVGRVADVRCAFGEKDVKRVIAHAVGRVECRQVLHRTRPPSRFFEALRARRPRGATRRSSILPAGISQPQESVMKR